MTTLLTIGNRYNLKSLLYEFHRKIIPSSIISGGVVADIQAHVEIGKVFGGYFNSPKNAKAFTKIGLSKQISTLPDKIKFADFGGGDGFLAAEVKDFIENSGKTAEGIVIDANPHESERARNRGINTMETAIEDMAPGAFDLIIMRATLHYNSKAVQKIILRKVKSSLKDKGIFVHQLSSGDPYNVRLRNTISHLPSLHRVNKPGSICFTTAKDYIKLCHELNFPTILIGYAPEDYWTPEEMFDRFHPQVKTMSQQEKKDYKDRNIFLHESKKIILEYKKTTHIEGIKEENGALTVWRKYPIFLSKLPR